MSEDTTTQSIAPVYHQGSVSPAREQNNPLRSLTITQAVGLMESAQRGEFLELQWLYWFCEQTEPVLYALQERRYGRLAEMDWECKTIPKQRRRRNWDESLALEQTFALSEMYDRIDNLKDAIEHLASATFRMFAHVNIQRDPSGQVNHLEPLDQWNFLRDGMFGDWYWNPEANATHFSQLPPANKIVPADFLLRAVARHIDRPALIKYIRKNLGEKDWSGFLEIYGMPTPVLVMPPNATDAQKSLYQAACKAIAEGRAVAVPNGTAIEFPDGVRGNAPFAEYLKWCDEQTVLIGTGGLLSMLSLPTGIGSGASNVHDAAFQSIARAEAYRISELFQRQLDKPFLAQAFPGKPILAYFEIAAQETTDPGTVLDHAAKAKLAGFSMDPAEISEMSGYKLVAAPAPAAQPPPPPQDEDEEEATPPAAASEASQDQVSLNSVPRVSPGLRTANAAVAAAGADAAARAQAVIMQDFFRRFEDLATQAKTEEEFLAAADAIVRQMPAELLTAENLAKVAAPLEGAIGAAILNTIAARKEETP